MQAWVAVDCARHVPDIPSHLHDEQRFMYQLGSLGADDMDAQDLA
jgi:hypothetical protein